ncbi:MAG: hypothetical protein IPL53_11420 [Ignavibacteria bacterium]|nr:hypothetical protein [Ignavibacteria bacterium]
MVPFTEFDEYGYWQGYFRLPDVLPDGNKFRFFGTGYDTIVIFTTGIIGLGGGSFYEMIYSNPVSIRS